MPEQGFDGGKWPFFVLAYAKHPEHVVKVGLFVSLGLLAVVLVVATVRSPWLSVDIQGIGWMASGRLIVQFGLTVRGKGTLGAQIVNLIVPRSLPINRCNHDGSPSPYDKTLRPLPNETVGDGEEAKYWGDKSELTHGTQHFFFAIDPGVRESVPFRVNVLDKRRDLSIRTDELNVVDAASFSALRGRLYAAWTAR